MHDRLTPRLYLEPSATPAEEYKARAEEVMAAGGVERATWWCNAHPGRTDLPRTVDEFATLGVYEVTGDFAAPSIGWDFVATGRPGQGVLTGLATTGLLLVLISPSTPERAGELRDWADFVHIRHIAAAAVPGYAMITPYERRGGTAGARYLHFYEMCSNDAEATFQTMTPLVRERLAPDEFRAWARHDALRIDYVNTFDLAGETSRA